MRNSTASTPITRRKNLLGIATLAGLALLASGLGGCAMGELDSVATDGTAQGARIPAK